jgi:hypothetical protein
MNWQCVIRTFCSSRVKVVIILVPMVEQSFDFLLREAIYAGLCSMNLIVIAAERPSNQPKMVAKEIILKLMTKISPPVVKFFRDFPSCQGEIDGDC